MPPDRNPYVGPRPFEADEARFFFGRDAEVEDLLALILSNQVVLLYSASGAGKTSLLNAAVISRLERDDDFEVLPVARFRGLRDEVPRDRNTFVAAILSRFAPDGSAAESLRAFLDERPHPETKHGFAAPRAVVIDQFEEMFTAYPERWDDRPGLFRDLAAALRDDPLLRVVLSIREDFIAQLDPYARLLPEGFRARYRLERLGRDAALRAVQDPARGAGCAFADGVAEQLVEDLCKVRVDTEHGTRELVGEFVEPVQLQVAARSLWQALPDAATQITEEHRQRFGNVDEVLGDFYDDAISAAAIVAHMRQDTLRARFAHAFITPIGTRGIVFWTRGETGGIPASAIDELDVRHLIRAELRAGARWYELTHDRLIEPIRASNRARDLRRRERRRRRGMIGGVILGAVAAASVAVLLWTLGSSSDNNWASTLTPIASTPAGVGSVNSITYAKGGRAVLVVGDQQSRTLAADDLQLVEDTLPPQKFDCKIEQVWQRWAVVKRSNVTLEATVSGCNVQYGQLTLSSNRTPLVVVGPRLTSIALSRKAKYAATEDANGNITVIDTHTGHQLVYRHPKGIRYATPAFGASVNQVTFAASDGTIRRASTDRHDLVKQVKLSPERTTGIAVDPKEGLIAAYGDGNQLELLDWDGHPVGALPGANLVAAAFNPSGDRLATVGRDGTVRIWQTRPDLVAERARLTAGESGARLVADIRNVGTTRSAATTVQSRTARQAIGALDPGASIHVRLSIRTPLPGIPVPLRIHPSQAGEWSTTNNDRYVWAEGDKRAQIVAAALTGARRGGEIRYVTLQAQAFQGVLDGIKLPDVPLTANVSMFVTWCYAQAGVKDPNGQQYETAADKYLRVEGTANKKTKRPRPCDLAVYRDAPIAIFVGRGKVVRWEPPYDDDAHPAVASLGNPYQTRDYLEYLDRRHR